MEQVIKEFLDGDNKASQWLKKNIDEEMSPGKVNEIYRTALEEWIEKKADKAKQMFFTTHPQKFTHPDVKQKKVNSVVFLGERKNDGFLKTGNFATEIKVDSSGNAAYLSIIKFFYITLSDGKTVLEHIEDESNYIKTLFNLKRLNFSKIRKQFLKVYDSLTTPATHERSKQVYFPVEDGYHLLSVLTSSRLLFEMKSRVDKIRFSEDSKTARKLRKKNKASERGYDDLFDLTTLIYGGSKPQNISYLNNKNAGRTYLLSSSPPTFTARKVRLPWQDFFKNCLWSKDFQESFNALHRFFSLDYNNKNIREGRDRTILFVLHHIIHKMWTIRGVEAGWSDDKKFKSLPMTQKIWLDQKYLQERNNDEIWLQPIEKSISRWIIKSYEKQFGKQAFKMGDSFMNHLNQLLENNKEGLL